MSWLFLTALLLKDCPFLSCHTTGGSLHYSNASAGLQASLHFSSKDFTTNHVASLSELYENKSIFYKTEKCGFFMGNKCEENMLIF